MARPKWAEPAFVYESDYGQEIARWANLSWRARFVAFLAQPKPIRHSSLGLRLRKYAGKGDQAWRDDLAQRKALEL